LGKTRHKPNKVTYTVMPTFIFPTGKANTKYFGHFVKKINIYFGHKSSLFSHIDTTFYVENQNMLELQIQMLHFLVILMLMQFYVMQP
jgi:hypothetical protein